VITISITGFLTDFSGGERTIVLDGSPQTVAAALDLLWLRHVGLRDRVVTERGDVRPHVGIFVNADHIRHLQELGSPLADGDELTILPAISGGSAARRRPSFWRAPGVECRGTAAGHDSCR
jgi:molybdopterin converting factor small subunit